MITYTANADPNNIILSRIGQNNINIPITGLHLNNGGLATTFNSFERTQQRFNYLDSLKDGANVQMLQALNIYPLAMNADGTYPNKDNIKIIRTTFLDLGSDFINRTSWIKVKKGTSLNPKKIYSHCLYDSGMSPTSFIHQANGNDVVIIKTFGTFIDPACKAAAGMTWPVIGDKVELTPKFMRLMGFGTSSSIQATTVQRQNTTDPEFDYKMKIGCGNACSGNNNCVLSSDNDADAQSYFAGNATKNTFLKTSGGAEAKVKFIVVKEWGDKLQVLFYLLKYKWKGGEETITFLTCDMPVFTLCINLNIPCIFTGAGERPGGIPSPKKWYSIMEFLPGGAFERAASHLKAIRGHIKSDNNRFIEAIQALAGNPNTQLKIGGSTVRLPANFYDAALADLNSLMASGLNGQHWSVAALQAKIEAARQLGDADKVPQLKLLEEQMKKDCLFIPFIANTKKMKELLNIGGPPNSLTVLEKKNYTKNSRGKPGFQVLRDRYNNMSFRLIAYQMKNNHQGGGGRQQRGGDINDAILYGQLFQGDSDEPIEFRWDDDGQNQDADDNGPPYEPSKSPALGSQEYPPFNPIHAANRSSVPPTPGNNGNIRDVQAMLYTYFISVHKKYMDLLRQTGHTGRISEDFAETIYTVFCYNSYIDNGAVIIFADADYDKILNELEIKPTIQESQRRIAQAYEMRLPLHEVRTGRITAARRARMRRNMQRGQEVYTTAARGRRVRGGKGRKKTKRKKKRKQKTRRKKKRRKKKTIKKRRRRGRKTRRK